MRLLRLVLASGLGLWIGGGAAHAQEELVMPFACDARGGGVRLYPAPAQSFRIYGPREQKLFRYCSPETPDRCRNWMLHRFEMDCDGVRVPWIQVAEAGAQRGRAWVENGRMSLQMGPVWASPREERRAWRRWFRKPAYGYDREPFGRPFGSQSDVVELPAGFAPVLGTGAQFIGHASEVSSAPIERSVEMAEIGPGASVEMEVPAKMPAREPAPSPPPKEPVVKTIKPPAPIPAKREPAKVETATSVDKTAPPPVLKPAAAAQTAAKPTDSTSKTDSNAEKAATPTAPESVVIPTIINSSNGSGAAAEKPSAAPAPESPSTVKSGSAETRSAAADAAKSEPGTAPLPQPEAASPIATGSLRDATSDSSESSASQARLLTIGFVLFGVIAASTIMLISRRRDQAKVGVVRRDIGAVTFDGHAHAPQLPAPLTARALPASAVDMPSHPVMPVDNFEVPTNPQEALRVIGASPDATMEAIKKIVDGLRQSWHPDLARSDDDRRTREERIKQINVAWDILADRRAA